MRLAAAALVLVTSVCPATLAAQDSAEIRGVRPPGELHAAKVAEGDFRDLVLSVKVLVDTLLRVRGLAPELRIISTWGKWAGLPCDCLTTRVYIDLNNYPDSLVAYSLPEMLDPTIDKVTTDGMAAVVYISYGLPTARRHAKVRASSEDISITAAGP